MSQDFIPPNDDLFADFAVAFVAWVNSTGPTRGLSPAQIAALNATSTAWVYSFIGFNNAKAAFRSATQDKDTKRTDFEKLIREAAGVIQKNPLMTDADRAAAHVTIPKGTHTPSTTPDTTPTLAKVDTSTRTILRLFVANSPTPDTLAKPANARCVEIREQIGGTEPVDPETMAFLAMESRMPYRADYQVTDIGKTVFLAFRWIGKNNQPGPWSGIFHATIPG